MALKRKRSDSEISTSSSLLSNNSPQSGSGFISYDSSDNNLMPTRSLFSARTRKRYRDNRPSESDVHEHTLSLLYSAQQNPQSFQQSLPSAPILPKPETSMQKSSLHSFWALPKPRQEILASNFQTPTNHAVPFFREQVTNCEDCDGSLNEGVDIDMMDMGSGNGHACTSCGRQVCHSCAVTNLGVDRKCLMCVGRRQKWVNGLGWIGI